MTYVLVIDTENYSGNFEREMCAYLTGQYGECGVGQELAEKVKEEGQIKHIEWWDSHIVQQAKSGDEDLCLRPVSIWTTPGWFNNGYGGHYQDIPENEEQARASAHKSAAEYHQKRNEMLQARIDNNDFEPKSLGWTKEACQAELDANTKHIQRASILTKYPAYLSIGVFVDELPPKQVCEEFQKRARYFADNLDTILTGVLHTNLNINVTGFRQVDENPKLKNNKKAKV